MTMVRRGTLVAESVTFGVIDGKPLNRAAVIDSEIERLQTERAVIASYGEDTYDDGTVIKFRMQFGEVGKKYRYAAIKANGQWFITGSARANQYLTWDALVILWRTGKVTKRRIATAWEKM